MAWQKQDRYTGWGCLATMVVAWSMWQKVGQVEGGEPIKEPPHRMGSR